MEGVEDILKKESNKCYDDEEENSDDHIGKPYDEIAQIYDGEHSVLLLFECGSSIQILGVQDDVLIFQDDSLECFVFIVAIEHDIECRRERILNAEFLEIIDDIRDLLFKKR